MSEPLVIGGPDGEPYAELGFLPDPVVKRPRGGQEVAGTIVIAGRDGQVLRFSVNAGRTIAQWMTETLHPRRKLRLISHGDMAERYGVSPKTAHNWSKRPDFPRPLDTTAAGAIWDRAEVDRWAKKSRPNPKGGRPRNDG